MKCLFRSFGSQPKRNSRRQRSVETTAMCDDVKGTVKPFDEIPGPKGLYKLPVIGAMFFFKPFTQHTHDTVHHVFKELTDQYGSLVRVRLGEWTVLVADPADIDRIRRSEGRYPQRRLFPIHALYCEQTGFKKGFAHLQGEEWHQFRSPVNALMLRSKAALPYLAEQNQVADDLVSCLKQDRPNHQNTPQLFYKYACESIGVITYNKRLGFLSSDIDKHPEKLQVLYDIQAVFRLVSDNQHVPEFITKYFPLREKKVYKEVADRLSKFARSYYEKTMHDIKEREVNGTLNRDKNNFMLSLMTADKMSVRDMVSIAMELFVAGADSVASNLQILLYNLARNPDKQKILQEEILRVVGPNEPLTEQALNDMSYLPATVKESFRVTYPIVSGTQRYLQSDLVLKEYKISKGTSVIMMNQISAKNEKIFPNSDSFLPERWLRDSAGYRSTPIPSSSLLPFGFGPRQCLGKKFAEQELYLAVTKNQQQNHLGPPPNRRRTPSRRGQMVQILQKFKVCLEHDHEEIEINYRPFIGTRQPIRFVFKERR